MARSRPRRGTPDGPGQVGKRPSSVSFLLFVSAMWLAVGIVILVGVSASWHLVPGIVAIGIGLFFLRGAAASLVRRDDRRRNG